MMDPTARADTVAAEVRQWYEAHRESWWDRLFRRWEFCADNFMLELVQEVHRAEAASLRRPDCGDRKERGE